MEPHRLTVMLCLPLLLSCLLSEPTGTEFYHVFLYERLNAVAVFFCCLILVAQPDGASREAKIPQCIIIPL